VPITGHAALRSAGDVAQPSAPQPYLQLPESTTTRVLELAEQLAAGSPSTYDTILAVHAWLGQHVEYDLDAPVPPAGADAVDHFLFESQLGFREQIATSTAMMLRSLDVPARLATGFVPSSRDAVAGVWISRARDAHAWVEVHFPGYGWVPFDPTASVPLSGDAGASTIGGELFAALSGWVSAHISLVLAVGLVIGACSAVVRLAVRGRARRRRGRWGLLQDRFVAAAIRVGAAPTAPNAQLADSFATPRAQALAHALDSSAFAPSWLDDDEQFARAVANLRVLEAVASGPPRDREPVVGSRSATVIRSRRPPPAHRRRAATRERVAPRHSSGDGR
jgi:hypothetical protein